MLPVCAFLLSVGISGQAEDTVLPNTGTDPDFSGGSQADRFSVHGSLRVSTNSRNLEHEDGTPFFYLGDTAWEICWKSTREEAEAYLNDRAAKGFTVIQMVAMSHQRLRNGGVTNRYGEPFFLEGDIRIPNSGYFAYVDWLVHQMNRRGMAAAIVPLWAYMSDVHAGSGPVWERPVRREEALLLANYLGARYADMEVIWVLGGDNTFDQPEQRDFWRQMAEEIDSASGKKRLKTIHTAGHTASFDYFDERNRWLDFHTYQSSHLANGDYTWKAGRRGYELNPLKPVLNAEAVYEDIYHNLWAPGDTNSVETFRIRDIHVRRALLESICSGALVGLVYGANGIWQWHTDDLPGSHNPRYGPLAAMNLPGSAQAGMVKSLLMNMGWPGMRPGQHYHAWNDADAYVPIASFDGDLLVYFPEEVTTVGIRQGGSALEGYWIDPQNGSTHISETPKVIEGVRLLTKPDSWADAIWVGRRPAQLGHNPDRTSHIHAVHPNPSRTRRVLELDITHHGTGSLVIVNVRGRLIARRNVRFGAGKNRIELPADGSGTYFYRLQMVTAIGQELEISGQYAVVR